jgi:mercuric ion transport protein
MSRSESAGAGKILYLGIVGSIVAAVCCVAPVLIPLLAAVGLSAWIGWLDYVLFPALLMFLGITAWAIWRQRRATAGCTPTIGNEERT